VAVEKDQHYLICDETQTCSSNETLMMVMPDETSAVVEIQGLVNVSTDMQQYQLL
jgi:hypothetical protein